MNEHLSLLVGRCVPTKVIRVRNKDKPWFDHQCRHAFDFKQEAHLRWTRDRSQVNWEEFVCCQVRANETNSEAKRQFSDRNRTVLLNVHSPHKWWSTLKSAVFGTSSSLPPLVSEGGGLVCEYVGKADLLSYYFDSKQSREAVDLPLTCHPSPSLTTFESGGLVRESVVNDDLLSDHFDCKQSRKAALICRSLAIRLLVLTPLPSGRERLGVSCHTWNLMVALIHWVCFLFFLRELLMLWPPVLV